LGGGFAVQQWVVDAYLLTLGSLILIAGSLSDLFGRKRILVAGLAGFLVTSLLCAVAPNALFLIIARGLQGIAGALLVPSSLALIISVFSGSAQGRAIGMWTAWTGIAFVIGPLLGGYLVDAASWRLIFAINVLPVFVTLLLMRWLQQPDQIRENATVDIGGALLCALGLGGAVYGLIEYPHYGLASPLVYLPLCLGVILFALFILRERRIPYPMLPMNLFKVRNFSVGNAATVAIYAGLSVATFLIAVFVQQVGGYTAIEAGLALLPVTIIMFLLSPRFGALAGTYGPRAFMAIGPIVAGIAFLLMLRVDQSVSYWAQLFLPIVLFGLGLSITVAPLTAAILGAIDARQAGIASAINNAVSRIAGLVAIAGVGILTGASLTVASFHRGIAATAILLLLGGVVSAIGISNEKLKQP
jgi:EmrB/QacA subfamily drug resistance transporter